MVQLRFNCIHAGNIPSILYCQYVKLFMLLENVTSERSLSLKIIIQIVDHAKYYCTRGPAENMDRKHQPHIQITHQSAPPHSLEPCFM